MELSLTRLPWYGQVGAFVLLAIGGVGAFVYYYEMPARADFSSRESQLEGLRKDISMGQHGQSSRNSGAGGGARAPRTESRAAQERRPTFAPQTGAQST
jgi:hypothetical protein